MVALPLFKLASLFVRHISKYGANRIKIAAHDHPRFRVFAARYGQSIHQLNMRLSVALLRNVEAEMRAKEQAEAPTVKTKEQVEKEEREKLKEEKAKEEQAKKEGTTATTTTPSAEAKTEPKATKRVGVWRRKFRPLPEAKAISLFADVVGDAFILSVATGLLMFEYWRTSSKPDANLERIRELNGKVEEMRAREEELVRKEEEQRRRMDALEDALRGLKDPRSKKPLLPSLQVQEEAGAASTTAA
ncbi:uncharacterized protein DNG_00415 [Cephalotrichum gorgonifer]|uniref:OPA3 domain-containing protein n=1 Tax=Cephalotrichum gorgonifer TaxID=2041049 RepID=A0AAE8MP31_9PEZI|nr:uncharacterized protein DNG_00415 [Cephalotrichum gorgonifer]